MFIVADLVSGSKKSIHINDPFLHANYIDIMVNNTLSLLFKGALWLSGRVLDWRQRGCGFVDWRQRGCGFEPQRRHCVVVLEQDTFILA